MLQVLLILEAFAHPLTTAIIPAQPLAVQGANTEQVLGASQKVVPHVPKPQAVQQPVRQVQRVASQQVVRQRPPAPQQPVRQVQRVASQQAVRQVQRPQAAQQPVRQAQNPASQQVVRQVQKPQAVQQPVGQAQRVASRQVFGQGLKAQAPLQPIGQQRQVHRQRLATQHPQSNSALVQKAVRENPQRAVSSSSIRVSVKMVHPSLFDYNSFSRAKSWAVFLTKQLKPYKDANFATECLVNHNNVRSVLSIPLLVWDSKLATVAQWWAQEKARQNYMKGSGPKGGHSPEGLPYGENLTVRQGSKPLSCAEVVLKQWSQNEISWYNGDIIGQGFYEDKAKWVKQYGHWAQVIWPITTSVGCGYFKMGEYQALVCEYSPSLDFNHRLQMTSFAN